MQESQKDTIRNIIIVGNSLTLSSTVIAFILFWFFKENRSFNFELQMWLTLSIFLYSVSNLLPYQPDTAWCPVQSFFINANLTSLTLWSTILGYSCLITMVNKRHLENYKNTYRIIFLIIAFPLPLGLSSIILFTKIYGDSYGFCWIHIVTEDSIQFIFKMMMMFYLIDWYIIIVNLFFILKICMLTKKNSKSKNELYSYIKWYPIVNVICDVAATVNRIYGLFDGKDLIFVLSIIQAVFDSLQGLVFMIIFLMSPGISQSIVVFCRRLFNKKLDLQSSLFTNDSSNNVSYSSNSNQNNSNTNQILDDGLIKIEH